MSISRCLSRFFYVIKKFIYVFHTFLGKMLELGLHGRVFVAFTDGKKMWVHPTKVHKLINLEFDSCQPSIVNEART